MNAPRKLLVVVWVLMVGMPSWAIAQSEPTRSTSPSENQAADPASAKSATPLSVLAVPIPEPSTIAPADAGRRFFSPGAPGWKLELERPAPSGNNLGPPVRTTALDVVGGLTVSPIRKPLPAWST
jgi:hypothetical protein